MIMKQKRALSVVGDFPAISRQKKRISFSILVEMAEHCFII